MGVSIHWYALAVVTSLLNGCTLGFIGWRERDRVLWPWSLAWFAWALAALSLALLGSPEAHPIIAVLCGCLWVVSSLLLLQGAYRLVGRPIHKAWYAVAVAAVGLALLLGVGPSGARGMMPLVVFQSVGLVATGVLLIRNARQKAGAWLCGGALIVLGLHLLDAPLLAERPGAFLWGFVLAVALQMLTALGMLMLYYEHAQTQLKKAQNELEQTRRIEALGRIAGGVAHDFNNMLTVMQGNVEMLRRQGRESAEYTEGTSSLDAIEETIDRAGRLTAQLLAFGRRSVLKAQPVDVKEIVSRTLKLLRQVIPKTIELRFVCQEGNYHTALDQALLEQIVLNLVTNARDAITDEGTVTVELQQVFSPRTELVLVVTDDGMGMDAATLERVFEPFFSSKEEHRGTGLGLASVQGAVTQLGGQIRVTSEKAHGSRFEIVLPWTSAEPIAARSTPSGVMSKLRVLVVDEDSAVLRTTVLTLTERGHLAEHATDAGKALKMARENSYDVIISDVSTPRMGLEFMNEIEKLLPRATIVLTSGSPRDVQVDASRVEFLPKPYKGEELLRILDNRNTSAPSAVESTG